ncbi:subtilisin-like protease [Marasmius fiardii PR-910]|nr:subtilisin-like protease [Marasmius fiardii PR-910]
MSFMHTFLFGLVLLARIGDVLALVNNLIQPTVPGKFIFELESGPGFNENLHESLYESLRSRKISFKIDKEFASNDVFVGGMITLDNPEDINRLVDIPGLVSMRPVRIYSRPDPIKMEVVSEDAPRDIQSTHVMTGVDKLHAEGITGEGIKIGMIDTGVDYTHPALGNGFGPGFKIVGGYDFVGDQYNGSNKAVPDNDPLDQCYGEYQRLHVFNLSLTTLSGHGTHVAGIIGADPSNPYNISGVAYSASLSSYRIFGCSGDTTDDIIIEALLQGQKDEQDVLNLSIGNADGWTEGMASVVASRIAAAGIVVTIAAGNDGASGAWFSSSPANAINAISVGSVDSIAITLNNATVEGVPHDPITYYSLAVFPVNGSLPIYATSNSTSVPDDACEPLPDNTPNLSKYIVIIRRGSCTFQQKVSNAAAKGAQFILIYDNGTGFGFIDAGTYTAALIQAADGEFLVKQFAIGTPLQLSFPQQGGTEFPNPAGGLSSAFSTYGPSNDFFFKPAVVAPGGNIMSTLPTTKGFYGVAAGTSMAAPFVAGSAALMLSVRGKTAAPDVRTWLETTAKILNATHDSNSLLETVAKQGSGLINVYDAVHGTSRVWPGELLINDTTHFIGEHTFTIQNTGNKTKKYTLTHVPAGTALTMKPDSIFPALGPVPLSPASATVFLKSTSIEVNPGQAQNVTLQVSLPTNPDASRFPLYSGFIQITSGRGSDVEVTHVTYLGLGASLKDKRVLDNTDTIGGLQVPTVIDPFDAPQNGTRNYTFQAMKDGPSDYPRVQLRMAFGTPVLRLDLVPADFTLDDAGNATFENTTLVSRYDYVSRNDEISLVAFSIPFSEPELANGTKVSDGLYKYLLRALRVTGDPLNNDDYDKWLSPVVGYNSTGNL